MDRLGALWLARFALAGFTGELLVIDRVTRPAQWLASILRACGFNLTVHELDFDFVDDVKMSDGSRAIEEIYFKTAPALAKRVEADPEYSCWVRSFLRTPSHEPYARAFFAKRILSESQMHLRSIFVASWYCRTRSSCSPGILYIKDGWLFKALAEQARIGNIDLRVKPEWTPPWQGTHRRIRSAGKTVYFWLKALRPAPDQDKPKFPRIAAEMCWNGIKRDPLYHTEFFWYRKPVLPVGAVFGYFAAPHDQPTPERRADLEAGGIGWIDREELRKLMYTPSRDGGKDARSKARRALGQKPGKTQSAVALRLKEFYSEYDRWYRFFKATGTRIHVSTYDVFPMSEAVHAAMTDAGGVSVSVQRSIERDPYLLRRTVTDVHFSFSKAQAKKERLSGSMVRQFIAAGYPYDDVFPAARAHGQQIAAQLRSLGAEFILCFFDENDGIHPKWLGGRRLIQGDYGFICDRMAEDKSLGLVLKPKRAETLRQRLGPVWPRVQELVDSGRCVILSGKAPDERYVPCVGACAADISINLLYGGTTGLESYLAGTRAVLIRHHVDPGVFGRLPQDSVLFESWDDLWKAVGRFREDRNHPHIGHWEPIVEEFASLRDGRAAHRIQQYLVWLYEAFMAGKNREEALEAAREKYGRTWGDEWITEIRQTDQTVEQAFDPLAESSCLQQASL